MTDAYISALSTGRNPEDVKSCFRLLGEHRKLERGLDPSDPLLGEKMERIYALADELSMPAILDFATFLSQDIAARLLRVPFNSRELFNTIKRGKSEGLNAGNIYFSLTQFLKANGKL